MKVTYNWLKEFVDIKIPAGELAEKLTMAGLEVKAVEGRSKDFVFEIEITSNRPDWVSVIGVAREVAALTGKKLKKMPGHYAQAYTDASDSAGRKAARPQGKEKISIQIEDKKDCPLYTARIIRNVKVKPSPQWLRDRLELVGLRSVNNVVDVTNYVLFELGEPLHAFDLDKLSGPEIAVRRSKNGESLVTIDGQARKLDGDIMVIADKEKPVAIAGVMGGKDTEVGPETKNILLEAAIFDPVVVRRGRQKLGMASDAAYRFERGIDPEIVELASAKAASLIAELCSGDQAGAGSSGFAPRKALKIAFSLSSIKKNLGIDIPAAKARNILSCLGFETEAKAKSELVVRVPSWRLDVKEGVDLVEELARIYGFENIPSTLASAVLKNQKERSRDHLALVKDMLVGLGLNEVVTYSLVEKKSLEGFWDKPEGLIEVSNPLSLEQEVMRPVLAPSLAARVAYNLRQQNPGVRIFEIAKTYILDSGHIREKYVLALALCGADSRWLGPKTGHLQDEPGFLHLKGIIETVLSRLGIDIGKSKYRFISANEIEVFWAEEKIGLLKKLPGKTLEALDIKHKDVFVAEFALEEKISPLIRAEKKFQSALVPRYPGIVRDITLPVKSEVRFEDIAAAIYAAKQNLLAEAEFKDVYEGEKVPAGFKRITVSCKYRCDQRTLTEEEISPIHEQIVKALQERFPAKIDP